MPDPHPDTERAALRRAALRLLGVDQLLLIVHDSSFPFSPGEDLGRGTPYSRESRAFAAAVRELGFTGLQLGPQGRTTAANASPYDGTLFSRDELCVAPHALVEAGWLDADALEELDVANTASERADHALARRLGEALWERAAAAFVTAGGPASAAFSAFVTKERAWLEPDALHDALVARYGGAFQDHWPEAIDRDLFASPPVSEAAAQARLGLLRTLFAPRVTRYAFQQLVMATQHAAWRAHLAALGLTVWGDMQIGIGPVDAWRLGRLFLDGYLLGAPPSRTNPAGQPWGYPVFDPDQLREEGAARALFRSRVAAAARDYDGIRIDHPHGLVCPWVYRAGAPDPYAAVRAGARLHESPDLEDHPELARYARVDATQVQHGDVPRHADDWATSLREEQVDAYAALLADVVRAIEAGGARASDRIACEVLSTRPTPLRAVIERLGLGRFRITQKADPDDPDDVYASERADPADWVMVGNHDTPPLWRLVPEWQRQDRAGREARHLAARLGDPARAQALAADTSALVHAKVADALASPARHAMLFFADLFGLDALYNRPGEVHPDNWRLRVPSDWRERLAAPQAHCALDLDECLALALRMRGAPDGSEAAGLVQRLTEGARRTSTR